MSKKIQTTCADDEVLVERVPRAVASALLRKDRSLRPGPAMMDGCVEGNVEAMAIRDAWAFNHPVKVVSKAEHEAMLARNIVTFHG